MKKRTFFLTSAISIFIFLVIGQNQGMSQPVIAKVKFLSGTSTLSDSAGLEATLFHLTTHFERRSDVDSMGILIVSYGSILSDDNRLWLSRVEAFSKFFFRGYPGYAKSPVVVKYSPGSIPFREKYLKEKEEVGLSITILFRNEWPSLFR